MPRVQRTGFLSYAHRDAPLIERLLDLLQPRCAILRELELDTWWDRRILVGERWREEIEAAVESAHFGFLCITPSFLASPYVTEVELPTLLSNARTIVPVGVERVDFERADLGGLEDLQIFCHRPPGTGRQQWFSECAGPNRARFCDALIEELVARLAPKGGAR